MSRTRNQRRRDKIAEKIFLAAIIGFLIYLLVLVYQQWTEIERLQEQRRVRESQQVTVVNAADFLPSGFDPDCPEYQAALQRYDEENGLVFGQKEAAPEWANSEAVDARDSAS